ncbi:MAG: type II toxin-antitoxin system RelB/DinJ family antitoxin [Clostridia bacterium]|nr:type II toxin-antitoxin system RelB/DinJ family antitoxin [Clostridia bacterium]
MSSSLIQIRVDTSAKNLASQICEAMGLDLQTYLRMCIAKLNQEMKIPFDTALDEKTIVGIKATIALDNAAARAREYGYADMTLDEINEEIAAARREADARKEVETKTEPDAEKDT